MTSSPSLYTRIICVIGIILSSYALYVEHKTHDIYRGQQQHGHGINGDEAEEGPFQEPFQEPFQALCDIEAIGASCSAVFNLPEGRLLSYFNVVPVGHILDVPNAFLGFLYYNAIFIIETFIYHNKTQHINGIRYITFIINSLAMSSSIFLAWKLIMIQELCILCFTTHLLNTLLLIHYGKRLLRGDLNKSKVA